MAGLPGEQEDWAIIRRANEEKRIAANQKFALAALDSVEQKLGIQQPDDWLTITLIEAWEVGLPKTVKGTSQLVELLKQRYPDRNWDKMFIIKGRFGQQRRLVQAVSALFPGMKVIINARREAGVINPATGLALELDVFLPGLNLAFEYQEKHHYIRNTKYAYVTLEEIQRRDNLKKELTHKKGITLIIVPCWWDNQLDSLAATVKLTRPDLSHWMSKVAEKPSIPETPPDNFFAKHVNEIEDIGEPVNPCFFTQVQTDPTNWWVFEKYDGVRGFWNPLKKAIFSRQGTMLSVPQYVIDDMPSDLFLDGELWFGRNHFQESMKIAHRMDHDRIDWNSFRFMVFDIPTSKGTYLERYNQLQEALGGDKERRFIRVAPYTVCEGTNHLEKIFQDIMDQGGEGIILRDPSTPFETGRSKGFLKHKKYRDAEAKVVSSIDASSWECELPNGVRFIAPAGTTEFAKRWNPQPGDIVSFKHRGFMLASNKPKMPTLYRIRTDMTWDDVVQHWKEPAAPSPSKGGYSIRALSRHKHGFWTDFENRKQFILNFAEKNGFDPMIEVNWKGKTGLLEDSQGSGLVARYGGSIKAMLADHFPSMFPEFSKPKGYWDDVAHRARFLLAFANRMGFDHSKAENWQRKYLLYQFRSVGGAQLLDKYGTMDVMLRETFPEFKPEVPTSRPAQ